MEGRNVEDVFVEVVDLGAVCDEDGGRGSVDRGRIVVVLAEEGEGDVVASADDDAMDVGEDVAPVLEIDAQWNRGEGIR